MWVETILSRDDLAKLLAQALPLTIFLGEDHHEERPDDRSGSAQSKGDHSLMLHDLGEVSLVPDVGLRVTCKANVSWPVLGIDVPIGLNSLTLSVLPTIRPAIGKDAVGDLLVFNLSIEHADFTGIPTIIDNRITEAINAKLAGPEVDLSWNFTKTLTLRPSLPALLAPLDSFAMRPAWGKIRITEEALVYAVSFHSAIVRKGDEVPADLVDPLARPAAWNGAPSHDEMIAAAKSKTAASSTNGHPRDPAHGPLASLASLASPRVRDLLASPLAAEVVRVGAFGLASGAAYFALRAAFRGRA